MFEEGDVFKKEKKIAACYTGPLKLKKATVSIFVTPL